MERTAEPTDPKPAAGGDGQVKEQTQAKAKEVAGKAQEQMGEARDQARARVREQVDERSTEAGELRKQGNDTPARYADQAADRAEQVGAWLRDSDGDRILGDVEDFARRNPWGVAAGGLVLGFVAARMLKASSAERYGRAPAEPSQLASAGPAQV